MADKTIPNANGAYGYNAIEEGWNNSIPVKASADITAKRVVIVTADGGCAPAATDSAVLMQLGIALEDIDQGQTGMVATQGFVADVPAQGTIAAGAGVTRSGTTAGAVAAAGAEPAAGAIIGVAISAAADGFVDVFLKGL